MTSGPGGDSRPPIDGQLRLITLLLSAIEDNLSSLQRLLSQVHGEVEDLLRDDQDTSRDSEGNALRREVEQLRYALTSRPVIERAKGVLMQRHRISEEESFALLNEESQRRRRKLREVAADVTSGAALGPPSLDRAPAGTGSSRLVSVPVAVGTQADVATATAARPSSPSVPSPR